MPPEVMMLQGKVFRLQLHLSLHVKLNEPIILLIKIKNIEDRA